jgi:hypothetical protein
MLDFKINNIASNTSSVLFSLTRFAITHPVKVVTALFAATLPSIRATHDAINGANDQETCNRWLSFRECNPLFDDMAKRTIPCSLTSRIGPITIDSMTFEGLPLNRFALERRPQWAIDGWKECMKKCDSILAEDGHEFGAYYLWYERAEILHAQAQIAEVLGNSTQAASWYLTASYWLHDAYDNRSMNREQMNAAQMKAHLDVQRNVALLQALTSEKPKEIEEAKRRLLLLQDRGYFNYESPADLLSLAVLSYENGDCPQARKLLELTEKLEVLGHIYLNQYITTADGCRGEWIHFISGKGPIFAATNPTGIAGDLSTARDVLKWLQMRMK